MDTLTIVLLVAVVLLAVGLAVVLLRQGGSGRADEAMRHQQMAMADTVQRVEQSLREQERTLAAVVHDRLAKSEETTGKIVTDLRERLVKIDAAQKQNGDLSTQGGGLHEILTHKQARGAFGEVQLNDLVQSTLPPSAYEFQSTLSTGARVDCLLKLPNPPGSIAIDAKFPLERYSALRAVAARDPPPLQLAQRSFQQAIRKHIGDIRDKYIVPGET